MKKMKNLTSIGVHVECVNGLHAAQEPTVRNVSQLWRQSASARTTDQA